MCAIQEINARIGRVTGAGISASIRKAYPRPVVLGIVFLLLISVVFNLGADLAAMGEAAHMLVGGARWMHILGFGLLSMRELPEVARHVIIRVCGDSFSGSRFLERSPARIDSASLKWISWGVQHDGGSSTRDYH